MQTDRIVHADAAAFASIWDLFDTYAAVQGMCIIIMLPSSRRPHYALHTDRPSVRPSVCSWPPLITRKRKIIQRSNLEKRLPTCRITGRAILRSKGQRSRSLGRKEGVPHIALAIGAALSSVQLNRHNTYIRTYIMLQCMFSMVLHRLF